MKWISKRYASPEGEWEIRYAGPNDGVESLWRLSLIVVVTDGAQEEELLNRYDLRQVVEAGEAVIVFPQCRAERWITGKKAASPDEQMLTALLQQADQLFLPWHPEQALHDLIGEGSGADLVCSVVARSPSVSCAAAICVSGGSQALPKDRREAAIPAVLVDMPHEVTAWFCRGCHTDVQTDQRCFCSRNPAQTVYLRTAASFCPAMVWPEVFARVRRLNLSPEGDAAARIDLPKETCVYKEAMLGDGRTHTWIEVPPLIAQRESTRMPVMLVSHGMGDSPSRVAEQTGMHLVGQKEGFLTVYPQASNGTRWNLLGDASLPDDMAFYCALIENLASRYPIDRQRVYTSGFSNGAGMAMMFALTHPELIAACCPIDSTFPYATTNRFQPETHTPWLVPEDGLPTWILPPSDEQAALHPLREALSRQAKRSVPLRLPVMYFYGTRESEYPIRTGSNQQLSADFWRAFNGVELRATDDTLEGEEAVGAVGDRIEAFVPDSRWPAHGCTEHIFIAKDGSDPYHFVLMHGKAHEVHPGEAAMGWAYVSRFSRRPDGSLNDRKG